MDKRHATVILSELHKRMNYPVNSDEYRDGVDDCIAELRNVLVELIESGIPPDIPAGRLCQIDAKNIRKDFPA